MSENEFKVLRIRALAKELEILANHAKELAADFEISTTSEVIEFMFSQAVAELELPYLILLESAKLTPKLFPPTPLPLPPAAEPSLIALEMTPGNVQQNKIASDPRQVNHDRFCEKLYSQSDTKRRTY